MKTLTEMWRSVERKVIPADAPLVQHEECYRAFMSGAAAARKLLEDGADLQPEIQAFFERMDRLARRPTILDLRGGRA